MTTFDELERSIDGAAPLQLYEFSLGPVVWRYTNAASQFVSGGFTWQPMQAAQTSEIAQSGEPVRAQVRLRAMLAHPIVQLYAVYPPSASVLLTIRERNVGAADGLVSWMGRVSSVVPGDATADIVCESFLAGMSTTGLRRRWQPPCPHALYGPQCRAPHILVTGSLTAVSGATIGLSELGSYADGKFAGGYLVSPRPEGYVELRDIDSHTGSTAVLRAPIRNLAVGDAVTAYLGCAHTMQACQDDHANLPNYGGFCFIPNKNPFGNEPVY